MIRPHLLTLLGAFLFAAALPAQTPPTQPTPTGRIGFVDIELVIENSRAIGDALDAVDKELAAQVRAIDEKKREFRRGRYDLDKQERILSPEEREKRRKDLADLIEQIRRDEFDAEAALRERERQIEPVLEHVMQVVGDVASREGFDLVLRGEVVIYGSRAVDLTRATIDELDKNPTKVRELFLLGQQSLDAELKAAEGAVATTPGATPQATATGGATSALDEAFPLRPRGTAAPATRTTSPQATPAPTPQRTRASVVATPTRQRQ